MIPTDKVRFMGKLQIQTDEVIMEIGKTESNREIGNSKKTEQAKTEYFGICQAGKKCYEKSFAYSAYTVIDCDRIFLREGKQ